MSKECAIKLEPRNDGYYNVYVGQKLVSEKGYDMIARNEGYAAVGIHDENPGCYKYLDRALILSEETGEWKIFDLSHYIGDERNYDESSKLQKLYAANEPGVFIAESKDGKARIDAKLNFTPAPEIGTVISPEYSQGKPETWFSYEICEKKDVLITLKGSVSRNMLLRLPGFNMSYNAFKFGGNWNGRFEFLNIDTTTGAEYTTNCCKCDMNFSTRRRCDRLIECIQLVIPNHPVLREQNKVMKVK